MINRSFIKDQIVQNLKAINPKKIVLFGSFNSKKFIQGESDIDLLVIKNSKKSMQARYQEARLVLTLDQPFDIFVLTENELKEKLETDFFFKDIINKGEILYETK